MDPSTILSAAGTLLGLSLGVVSLLLNRVWNQLNELTGLITETQKNQHSSDLLSATTFLTKQEFYTNQAQMLEQIDRIYSIIEKRSKGPINYYYGQRRATDE